jgi:succinate dehydrogenase / fumarate reductase, membrane anchor subunit
VSLRRASGFRAWLLQRVTAIYLGLFTPVLLWRLVLAPPASYLEWREWVAGPWVNLGLLLFALSVLLHAWVGVRDILVDYVHPLPARLALLSVTGFGLVACGLWLMQILFRLGTVP